MLKLAEKNARGTGSVERRADFQSGRPIPPLGTGNVVAITPQSLTPLTHISEIPSAAKDRVKDETSQQVELQPDKTEISSELQNILASKTFAKAFRLRSLLGWIVNRWLEGREEELDSYTIAMAVFGRDKLFDPAIDPIVRVEVARLRRQILKYYSSEGSDSFLRIDLPKGGYTPRVWYQPSGSSIPCTDPRQAFLGTIMILPFTGSGGNDRSSRAAQEIYDHLIWLFTQFENIHVVSRISSAHISHTLQVRRLRKAFGARFIVEGIVSRADAKTPHLIIHLTETSADYNIWSGYYPLGIPPIVSLSRQIVSDLLAKMSVAEGSARFR